MAGVNSSITGYFQGGGEYNSTVYSQIDSISFTTEILNTLSATLGTARYGTAGFQSGGYL